ncbi:MAG TPA: hypothetical protein VMU54_04930, partial [Planctomycetota bacterium]|nr:hypothetical protein [Planctomycetota bacterium]
MGLFLAFVLAFQQDQIDEAIRKGIAHLKAKAAIAGEREEQLLLALVEVGVPASDPTVAGMLETLLAHPPTTTRSAARQARILSLLDRNAYRDRLGHCAQFLVDNQSRDGRWGPGQPVEAPDLHPEPLEPPSARTPNHVFGASSQVIFKILFRRKVPVAETGDLENSYAAILGLSACRSAGILAPRETLEKALETWRVAEVDPFRR